MNISTNISLPESLEEYVRQRVVEGDFANSSDYIRALIRVDTAHQAQTKRGERFLEGLEAGESLEADDEYWRAKRHRLVGRRQSPPDEVKRRILLSPRAHGDIDEQLTHLAEVGGLDTAARLLDATESASSRCG
jgi:putative addiction module CopG family antidote